MAIIRSKNGGTSVLIFTIAISCFGGFIGGFTSNNAITGVKVGIIAGACFFEGIIAGACFFEFIYLLLLLNVVACNVKNKMV